MTEQKLGTTLAQPAGQSTWAWDKKKEDHEWYSLAPGVSHLRLFPRECLLPPALLTVWGVGGGGRGGGAQEGGARLCLELAGQLEGVAEAQVPRAGGRVSGDDVLRVGAEGGQRNTTVRKKEIN